MSSRLPIAVLAALAVATAVAVPVAAATPGAVSADFSQTATWAGGYQAQYTISNLTTLGLSAWKVEFDLPTGTTLAGYWDALETVTGSHYTFTNRNYNGTVAPGTSVTFGFTVSGSAAPTNCALNGGSCVGVPDTTAPTAPANLAVKTTTSGSVSLKWSASTDNVGVTGYDVYRGSTKASTVTGTTATVSGLSASTAYTFTVTAHDGAGNSSAASNQVTATTKAPSASSSWDLKVAPYLDLGSWPTPSLPDTAAAAGVNGFTLAFVTGVGCKASWFNAYDPTTGWDRADIDALRAAGGDVTVSFGGASGSELAGSCTDEAQLLAQYQAVVSAYSLTRIDFDIEGAAVADHVAVDRRSTVLARLQQANPGLQISLTLPVMPTGLTDDGVYIVGSAVSHGVKLGLVNVMAMDYYQHDTVDMGVKAQQAAQATHDQLAAVYPGRADAQLWGLIGVTPMIGVNDDSTVFSLANTSALVGYANRAHLGMLAFWETTRDRNACTGAVYKCTNVAQQPYDFATLLAGFTG